MAYVAQLHPLHEIAVKSKKSVVQGLFHVLNNTYPIPLIFRMGDIKAPQPVSLQGLSRATRLRAAVKTLTTWQDNLRDLNKCRSEHAPLQWFVGRAHSDPWWDTPPIVDLVSEAFNFGGKFGRLKCDVESVLKGRKNARIQSTAVKILTPLVYPIDIPQELSRRLRLWLPPLRESRQPSSPRRQRDLLRVSCYLHVV
jgi:hypothetical protein